MKEEGRKTQAERRDPRTESAEAKPEGCPGGASGHPRGPRCQVRRTRTRRRGPVQMFCRPSVRLSMGGAPRGATGPLVPPLSSDGAPEGHASLSEPEGYARSGVRTYPCAPPTDPDATRQAMTTK